MHLSLLVPDAPNVRNAEGEINLVEQVRLCVAWFGLVHLSPPIIGLMRSMHTSYGAVDVLFCKNMRFNSTSISFSEVMCM